MDLFGVSFFFFFFNDTATTEIYTLSLHDALPVCVRDHSIRSGSSRWHLKLQRLSSLDIGPVHAVDVNLRPPTVALAVRGDSVRPARPIISRRGRVIFPIFMSARIEPQR